MKSGIFAIPANAILFEQNGLSLQVCNQADEQAVALLRQTTYGTKGIRYRQKGGSEKLHRLHNPLFFHLYYGHELIGFYCLDQRPLTFACGQVSGYYGRYLAVREDRQGNGYGQLLKSTAVRYIEQNTPAPYLLYSYIEARNTRSMAASVKEHFTSVAQLKTFLFRRFSPKIDRRFRQASVDPIANLKRVEDRFAHYGFQNFLNINYGNNYFTLEEDGQVVAGVQANSIHWEIIKMPGPLGSFLKHLAPFVPGLRRFFNPARQAFVVLEGIYLDPTRPELLPVLLESVVAHFNQHTAMFQIDEKDPLVSLLASPMMGSFSQFQPGVTTHLMVKATGLPAEIQLGKEPAYISCFDYS